MHAIRILEFAAAIALVLKPSQAAEYMKELGVDIDTKDKEDGSVETDLTNIHSNMMARMGLRSALGL